MARISRQDALDLLSRAVAPGVVVYLVIIGIGFLITGPLKEIDRREDLFSAELNRDRRQAWNGVSDVWSHFGNTEYVIAVCVIVALILLWRTRDLPFAVTPVLAISLQATIFVLAAWTVGRQRPPAIPMDASPPTSSYPSGHVGASTALYATFALLAQRIERAWLRWLVTVVCVVIPLLVASARLYRGAHHPSDVVVGMLNGIVCALLAHGWLRHVERRDSRSLGHAKAPVTSR
jgi:membrane-associated phospholipid phosphatase